MLNTSPNLTTEVVTRTGCKVDQVNMATFTEWAEENLLGRFTQTELLALALVALDHSCAVDLSTLEAVKSLVGDDRNSGTFSDGLALTWCRECEGVGHRNEELCPVCQGAER